MRTLKTATLEKFSKFSNEEAYVEAFHKRLMKALPETERTGEYWGSSTRADLYPHLKSILSELETELDSATKIRLLDVGAGSGEVIDHVLKDYKSTISAVEPNPLMLDAYLKSMNKYDNLMLGSTFRGTVQSLYQSQPGESWLSNLPLQNLVISSHMIYGLTRRDDFEVSPAEDLLQFISAMYEKLAENGVLFVVYAVGENTILGEAGLDYLRKVKASTARNVQKIWEARKNVLENKEVVSHLNELFGQYCCEASSVRTDTRIYGESEDDIAAYCILGDLTEVNSNPFNLDKLCNSFDFIEKHGKDFGLEKVEGGVHDGMISSIVPQVICRFKKLAKEGK